MMGHRKTLKGGDEFDGLRHRAKRFHIWRAGQRKAIKRGFAKRVRRDARLDSEELTQESSH